MMTDRSIKTYTCSRCGTHGTYIYGRRKTQQCQTCRHDIQHEVRKGALHKEPTWVLDAACRSVDPELFYDDQLVRAGHYKVVCNNCPVQQECLTFAWAMRDTNGIWGGLTPQQRRRMVELGCGPTQSAPGDVTRCCNCGAWKEAHRFCTTCLKQLQHRRTD